MEPIAPKPGTNTAQAWSIPMAESVLRRGIPSRWLYQDGLLLKALAQLSYHTGEEKYLECVREAVARLIDPEGRIAGYAEDEFNLDQINPGKLLFPLARTSAEPRYKRALATLREQLRRQPRTTEGGFWHKKIYPHQIWLDGLYMAAPFYAEYGRTFAEPEAFEDVARQFLLVAKHNRDDRTGLYYHGWDESRQQRWANPVTGCSSQFWGRAVGWLAMALVDVIDLFPLAHPQRQALVGLIVELAAAVERVQDPPSGLWYQVLDQGPREGNYLEASASCMFVYALARGVRRAYLDARWMQVARRGYRGILGNLIHVDDHGLVNLEGTCGVAGLGGTPYRDGSYEYYVGEKTIVNDSKGVGPFLLASIEMESLA